MPKCPHCGQVVTLDKVGKETQGSFSSGLTMFYCPHCETILGFGRYKR